MAGPPLTFIILAHGASTLLKVSTRAVLSSDQRYRTLESNIGIEQTSLPASAPARAPVSLPASLPALAPGPPASGTGSASAVVGQPALLLSPSSAASPEPPSVPSTSWDDRVTTTTTMMMMMMPVRASWAMVAAGTYLLTHAVSQSFEKSLLGSRKDVTFS